MPRRTTSQAGEILKKAKAEKVKIVELQFSDLTGRLKKLEIEVSKLADTLKFGQWYDGSSVIGHARIFESDMRLVPDLATFAILPWQNQGNKIARFICDISTPDGKPFEGDPRFILKKALAEAKKLGFTYYVGPELEFFLFARDKLPQLVPHDQKGYFDDTGKGRAWHLLRKVMDSLQTFGISGECHHHEVAIGQHEIDIQYDEALKTADNLLTLKTLLKNFDHKFGLKVTFMPKPIQGINGSGMHVHQSLFRGEQNAFYDPRNEYKLSTIALHFLAGQLKYARALCALVASSVNSYKRLVPGYEAPVNICWGQINRSALIRVPRYTPGKENSTRLELRCPDPYCNPYLAFAGMLTCGLAGIKEKLVPAEPVNEDVYHLDVQKRETLNIFVLPAILGETINELRQCNPLVKLLGNETLQKFIASCQNDIEASKLEVTPWEIERYL